MENYEEYYDVLGEYEDWLTNQGILSSSDYGGDVYDVAFLGPNDLGLAQKLILAGNEHAKFMRQIFVSVDKSPHCVQLHYIQEELRKMMNIESISIKNFVLVDNELIEIKPEIISLSKNLSSLKKLSEKL